MLLLNNPEKITPNTHTNTPNAIVANPAPTNRKHCNLISFHVFFLTPLNLTICKFKNVKTIQKKNDKIIKHLTFQIF